MCSWVGLRCRILPFAAKAALPSLTLALCVSGAVSPLRAADMSPVLVGTLGVGAPSGIALQGSYVYCAAGGGLEVFDISDPAHPTPVGSCDVSGWAADVAISGSFAYIAAGTAGLQVVDVSDPARPVVAAACGGMENAWAVTLSGSYAYVADCDWGLRIIDISDPLHPVQAAAYQHSYRDTYEVTVSGSRAYVPAGYGGLRVVDISDPTSPVEIGVWQHQPLGSAIAVSVAVSGDYAYVACDGSGAEGLHVLDISDPSAPQEVGHYQAEDWTYGVGVSGDTAYMLEQTDAGACLRILSLADPIAPEVVGSFYTTMILSDFAVVGEYVYAAFDGFGMGVLDASDPETPVLIGQYTAPGWAYAVAAQADHAYVLEWGGPRGSLHIVDTSRPPVPLEEGSCPLPVIAENLALYGDYAYVACGSSGLRIVDVSDSANPSAIGSWVSASAVDVAISGSHAYLADFNGSLLRVLDISIPQWPRQVGECTIKPSAIAVQGDLAYLASSCHLAIADISDPANPSVIGCCENTFSAWAPAVTVADGYAYKAAWETGLIVVDVTQPTSPREVAVVPVPAEVHAVAVSGRYAYVSASEAGLYVLDISKPAMPVVVGVYPTWGAAMGADLAGDLIYLCDYGKGLSVLRVAPGFSDVPSSHWAFDEIQDCYRYDIVLGYADRSYHPEEPVTRDQMAVYISRGLAGGDGAVPDGPPTAHFSDVPPDHWAYKYIEYALAAGVALGYPDGSYRPGDIVGRGQMAVYMARALCGGDDNVPDAPDGTPSFPDVGPFAWTYKYVEYCHSQGVVGGYPDGSYRPGAIVDRAQMAVYVARAFALVPY